jgi:hypothetical protein
MPSGKWVAKHKLKDGKYFLRKVYSIVAESDQGKEGKLLIENTCASNMGICKIT